MAGVLTILTRHAPLVLALGVFAGLILPDMAAVLGPVLAPSVWGLLFLSMLRIDWQGLGGLVRQPVMLIALVAWLLIASPVLMGAGVWAAGLDGGLATALVLMAGAPPIMSSPALALLIGLDAPLCLAAMIAATLLVPVVLPIVAVGALDLTVATGTSDLALRLALFIGSAVAAGAALRRWLGVGWVARNVTRLDAVAVVLLLLFAVAIMDGVAARLIADPVHVLGFVAAAFAANAGLQLAGAAAFARLGRWRALTTGFVSGNRNMALLLAVLPAATDPDVRLYFALAQIPIYVMPALIRPVYRRLLEGFDTPFDGPGSR